MPTNLARAAGQERRNACACTCCALAARAAPESSQPIWSVSCPASSRARVPGDIIASNQHGRRQHCLVVVMARLWRGGWTTAWSWMAFRQCPCARGPARPVSGALFKVPDRVSLHFTSLHFTCMTPPARATKCQEGPSQPTTPPRPVTDGLMLVTP